MLCSKLDCRKSFQLKAFSYKDLAEGALVANVQEGHDALHVLHQLLGADLLAKKKHCQYPGLKKTENPGLREELGLGVGVQSAVRS